VGALSLADFHALRAVALALGWLHEEELEITCRNCDEELPVHPCAVMPLGPFVDGELTDPRLDRTGPFDRPVDIPPIERDGQPPLESVTLAPRTVEEATPLHRALRRRRYVVGPTFVQSMGIRALGSERDPVRIARILGDAPEGSWRAVCAAFLDAHYPLRLVGIVACPKCKARNDVDAPNEREFERGAVDAREKSTKEKKAEPEGRGFPSFELFNKQARNLFRRIVEGQEIRLVVESGVPSVDDGGEPLLGSYTPGDEGSETHASEQPEIAVYYRTFRQMWSEDGPYDWKAELEETIAHEFEHHLANLRGDDPVDDEERAEIVEEALRVHGHKELARQAARGLGGDFADFFKRTWPIWLLVGVAIIVAVLGEGRSK
jgi:hypothetical protein